MYFCPECKKEIKACPGCKQRITDGMALLLYQISAVMFAVAVVLLMLELELREGTAVALRPFKEASEIAEKKSKIEAVKLPTPPKAFRATHHFANCHTDHISADISCSRLSLEQCICRT